MDDIAVSKKPRVFSPVDRSLSALDASESGGRQIAGRSRIYAGMALAAAVAAIFIRLGCSARPGCPESGRYSPGPPRTLTVSDCERQHLANHGIVP